MLSVGRQARMMALPGRILRIQRILRITAIYRSLLGTEQRFKVELAAMPTVILQLLQ